jgi:hypothetical protein
MLKLSRLLFCSFGVLSISFALTSCSTFDPPTVVPSYGHIDSIHFSIPADSANLEGSASSAIKAAWVYLDDNPVGTFQMPCTFPIVAGSGYHNIKIYSGVEAADANSAYSINPFYQFYSINVNLQQGKTTKFQPVSTYYNWVKFKYMENFDGESPGSQPQHIVRYYGGGSKAAGSDTVMFVTRNKSLVFDGTGSNGSGLVKLDENHTQYVGMTDPPDSLPYNGTPVYLEFNYRTTTFFSVGLFEEDTVIQISPSTIVYPSSTWKKLYVDLYSRTISTYHAYPNNYRVYFLMNYNTGDVADTLLLDNIKIIY